MVSVHSVETAAVECSNLTKAFAGRMVVEHATLTARPGRILALLGPSGSGKSTTLRMIAGFEWPDNGTISINGRVVAADRIRIQPEYRHVGMVFQENALFSHLDVAANTGFGLNLHLREKEQRVESTLAMLGLTPIARRMPYELSGGEQQQVALARALAGRPDVLLLDEPFASLDPILETQLHTDLRSVVKETGTTCILVTHNQEEALSLADEVAVMINGRILQSAAPEVVYHRPVNQEVAAFVGEANFLRGDAQGSEVECALGRLPLLEPVRGAVDVMVRPEQIRIKTTPTSQAATITWREFYGHDQRVGLCLADGTNLVARFNSVRQYSAGQAVQVSVSVPVVAFPRR